MEITGAKILVGEAGKTYSTDLIRILSERDQAYFQRNPQTNNFEHLCCKDEGKVDEKLRKLDARPYLTNVFDAANIRYAIRSEDKEEVSSQLEGILEVLKKNNLWVQEE